VHKRDFSIKSSRATSRVKWLNGEKNNVSRTIFVLVLVLKVLKWLVFSPFNHLTRLVAREDFIVRSRRESCRSYEIWRVYKKVLPAYSKYSWNTDNKLERIQKEAVTAYLSCYSGIYLEGLRIAQTSFATAVSGPRFEPGTSRALPTRPRSSVLSTQEKNDLPGSNTRQTHCGRCTARISIVDRVTDKCSCVVGSTTVLPK
jgi:hypothetical protein